VADAGDSTVRKIDAAGIITTVVGSGVRGFNGDGLKGPLTALSGPSGVALDDCGNLLVADPGNDRVRRLTLAATCRPQSSATSGGGKPYLWVAGALVAAALAAGLRRALRARS